MNVNVRSEQPHEFRSLQTGQLEKLETSQFIGLTTVGTAFLHQECASQSLYLWHEISHKAQIEAQCLLSFTENGLGVHFSITPKMILIQVLL